MAPLENTAPPRVGITQTLSGRPRPNAPRSLRASRSVDQPRETTSLGRGDFLQFLGASAAAAIFTVASLRSRIRKQVPGEPNLLLNTFSCGTTPLRNPKYLGGGVQAEVFSADAGDRHAVVKLSRTNTDYAKRSLEHERKILKILNDAKVPNVERCLGFGEITTTAGPRQGMVLTPCLPGRNISVKNGCGNPKLLESQEENRMERLMATAVRVLEAGVAGVDVQVLQSPSNNDMLWIDFTEAALLKKQGPGSLSVEAPPMICPEYEKRYRSPKDAVVGFATEIFLMVPPSSHEGAAKALAEELQELSECPQRGVGKTFQDVWQVWTKLPWKVGALEGKRLETAAESAAGVVAA